MGAVRSAAGGPGGKRGVESPRVGPPRRKAGPIPAHITARRPSSPAPASPASPGSLAPRAASPLVPQLAPHLAPQPASPSHSTPPVSPAAAPLSPVSRRPASPLAPVPSELPSGRPPEEPPNVECVVTAGVGAAGSTGPVSAVGAASAVGAVTGAASVVAACATVTPGPVAPHNLPPVMARSPSPPEVFRAHSPDTQELQINAILQGLVEIKKHNMSVRAEVYRAILRHYSNI
ncbi:unnamed protein product [Leptidea sinapis]|uniref:Uncharacterized protein n=1 Tax=Leptidea sinapis TaxID=189913 RepID=A0A5E4R0A9_9NEOP|nr:unnamed protein product [Leptidea sinapis]